MRFRFLLPAVLLLLAALPARAQDVATDSTLLARFRLADSYLRGAQYDRAIRLLEDLHRADPSSYVFYGKLGEAYRAVKRYDDAIALVEARLAGGRDPILLAERASLLYLKGDEAGAFAAWDAVLALDAANPTLYNIVYTSLFEQRLFDRAIGVLERGRERFKDQPDLFVRDLAYLYSLNGEHGKAAEQYLKLLERDERQVGFVRARLARFTETGDATAPSIEVFERGTRRAPLNRGLREVLAWLYLEARDFDKALDVNRAIDRMEREEGRVLFLFAQTAANAEAYPHALEAYREVLARYPDSPAAPEAQFGLGHMHELWAETTNERALDAEGQAVEGSHYAQARAAYRKFLDTYPAHPVYPEALRRIGRLELDVFHDLDAAESTLREVTTRYARSPAAEEAAFDLGRIAVLRGDLDGAALAFNRLEETLRVGDLADRARYERVLLHLYRGEFEAAQQLAEVLNDNTSNDTANDAIELKVLLIENRGPDSLSTPLLRYAGARLLLRQRDATGAIDALDAILRDYAEHGIVDEARFLRAHALREANRPVEAAVALQEFRALHPQSYLADRSLLVLADVQEHELNDRAAAIQTLTNLLTEYPGSLLAAEARTRVRRLRGDTAL